MIFTLLSICYCERSFKIVGDEFQMDGKPFRYVSGSFHYFRSPPEKWEDNIKKMSNGGLNCVQTYIPWNLYEPSKGVFKTDGDVDFIKFIEIIKKYDMYMIVRPGPFICAEWDFGGLPYWLNQESNISFRSSDPTYLNYVKKWFTVLLEKLKPYLYVNGGPIIMIQVENEYGFYPKCDHEYMKELANFITEKIGNETLLFTIDTPSKAALDCGTIKEQAFVTVDFRVGNPEPHFEIQKKYNGHGPYVNSEFYTGKHDLWGDEHHYESTEAICNTLDKMLSMNASVNFYMYCGGTNFGFYNGANGDSSYYAAMPTSYDFDSPISETGDMTWKYEKIKEVIKKYLPIHEFSDVKNTTKKSYGKVAFNESVSLFDSLQILSNQKKWSEKPLTFEELDLDYGFILYESYVNSSGYLNLSNVNDRANVYLNGKYVSTIERKGEKIFLQNEGKVDVLVENEGRINYGEMFDELKGLYQGVLFDQTELKNWNHFGFNLSYINQLQFTPELLVKQPAFYRGYFNVDEVADTFLNPTGFQKGVAFINGFNIGRFWINKPQLTLYVPQSLIHVGQNELVIFEIESQADSVGTMSFDDTPQIDVKSVKTKK